ncbi:MAG: hypothetical protein H7315_04410 [Herminiimonas sp.]|nr:hypothetical protein [Herminiimonas sp.]
MNIPFKVDQLSQRFSAGPDDAAISQQQCSHGRKTDKFTDKFKHHARDTMIKTQ